MQLVVAALGAKGRSGQAAVALCHPALEAGVLSNVFSAVIHSSIRMYVLQTVTNKPVWLLSD